MPAQTPSTQTDDLVALSRQLLAAARARDGDFAALAARLRDHDPARVAGDARRLALWLNLYNAALLRELATRPRRGSLLRHRRLFRSASLTVGAHEHSLDVIEHGLLRRNARPPYALRRLLRDDDPRLAAAPSRLEPRIHFALNCGARSCPPVQPYTAESVAEQLERAARAYLAAESELDRERGRLVLPGLMKLYREDFGTEAERLDFAADHLPEDDADWIRANRDRIRISWSRFDWTLEAA